VLPVDELLDEDAFTAVRRGADEQFCCRARVTLDPDERSCAPTGWLSAAEPAEVGQRSIDPDDTVFFVVGHESGGEVRPGEIDQVHVVDQRYLGALAVGKQRVDSGNVVACDTAHREKRVESVHRPTAH
jgi:hypothetical protein